jgi:hypothetical protein
MVRPGFKTTMDQLARPSTAAVVSRDSEKLALRWQANAHQKFDRLT